jgi:hypothetical protein
VVPFQIQSWHVLLIWIIRAQFRPQCAWINFFFGNLCRFISLLVLAYEFVLIPSWKFHPISLLGVRGCAFSLHVVANLGIDKLFLSLIHLINLGVCQLKCTIHWSFFSIVVVWAYVVDILNDEVNGIKLDLNHLLLQLT